MLSFFFTGYNSPSDFPPIIYQCMLTKMGNNPWKFIGSLFCHNACLYLKIPEERSHTNPTLHIKACFSYGYMCGYHNPGRKHPRWDWNRKISARYWKCHIWWGRHSCNKYWGMNTVGSFRYLGGSLYK